MNVMQLIDSLDAGGAERVALNYANALVNQVSNSFLCVTRAEGILKPSISKNVNYKFLRKKSTLDVKAIIVLNKYVKRHDITIIHAHSSSYFLATIIKCLNPSIKLVWHDHYGKSEYLEERPKFVLKLCSVIFNAIVCVNSKLVKWSKEHLKTKTVDYLPNFAVVDTITQQQTQLKGKKDKRIVCLANLREQKDHLNLLHAFKGIHSKHSDWTLHLVGKDFNDAYSQSVHNFIKEKQLSDNVFLYGSCKDTSSILSFCDIGVLSSRSEGLPLALLEYGLAKLPVVVTEVGYCDLVVQNKKSGLTVEAQSPDALKQAIEHLIENCSFRVQMGLELYHEVIAQYSIEVVMKTLLNIYKTL